MTPYANTQDGKLVKIQQQNHLFSLPQELQDLIYAFAYPQMPSETRIVFRHQWAENEIHRRKLDQAYTLRAFPQHTVNRFMVSKRFFMGASRAYMRNQIWCATDVLEGITDVHFRIESNFLKGEVGLFFAHATHATFSGFGLLFFVLRCRSITSLRITVSEQDVNDLKKLMWLEECSGSDFQHSGGARALLAIHGLRSLSLVAGYNEYAKTPEKKQMWAANMRHFESYVKSEISGRKRTNPITLNNAGGGEDSTMKASRPTQLYRGAEVTLPLNRADNSNNLSAKHEQETRSWTSLLPPPHPTAEKPTWRTPTWTTSPPTSFPVTNWTSVNSGGPTPDYVPWIGRTPALLEAPSTNNHRPKYPGMPKLMEAADEGRPGDTPGDRPAAAVAVPAVALPAAVVSALQELPTQVALISELRRDLTA